MITSHGKNQINKARHTHPVRKPPASRYGNNRHIVYSPTLQRRLILGSDLEFDQWVLLEAARKKFFCEQPLRVQVRLAQGLVTTVFDFWIHWQDGSEEYREVKYSKDLEKGSRACRQIEAQQKFCELQGFKHVVATEKNIRANSLYLENWKTILHDLAMVAAIDLASLSKQVVEFLHTSQRSTIATIFAAFTVYDRVLVQAAVYSLIHQHILSAALDSQILSPSLCVEVNV
jgi:hypothetical protein